MRLSFRQGIVTTPVNISNEPDFLNLSGNDIFINTQNGSLLVTFSQGDSEYLLRETDNAVILAFPGPFLSTETYWLYWDIHPITGHKGYGTTTLEPRFGSVLLSSPAIDQHFFSTVDRQMYVWNGTTWLKKVRCFAGRLQNTQITNTYPLIGGSQPNKRFFVPNNVTGEFVVNDPITITQTAGNDGVYTIVAYTFNSSLNRTEITVSQNIPNPTAFSGYLAHTPAPFILGSLIDYGPGSQANLNQEILSGPIFYDQTGAAVKKLTGEFYTTETPFIIGSGQLQPIKLEESFIFGTASVNIGAYSVVTISNNPPTQLIPAAYEDTNVKILGMLTDTTLFGQVGTVILQGVVTNPAWNWSGGNVTLWVDTGGALTATDPNITTPTRPKAPPIARTINKNQIIFMQGMGGPGVAGPQGAEGEVVLATSSLYGTVKLSLPPVTSGNPIAVGDNDPRLTDARNPLPHNHGGLEIIVPPFGSLTATTVQLQIQQLETNKLAKSGGTMTGPLILNGPPISALSPVTLAFATSTYQPFDPDLTALATLGTTGYIVRTGSGTAVTRTITGTPNNITVLNGSGVLGNTSIDLADFGSPVTNSFVKITTDSKGRVSATTSVVALDITSLVDATYVNVGGDTMTGFLILNADPVAALGAVTKQYVDAAVAAATAGITYVDPIRDPNLNDIRSTQPVIAAGNIGDTLTYIKYGGVQGETWVQTGTSIAVDDGDVAIFTITGTSPYIGDWFIVEQGPLVVGDRYVIAGTFGTAGATLIGMGFVDDDLIEYNGGAVNVGGNWTRNPDNGIPGTTPPDDGITALVNDSNSPHFGATYFYSAMLAQWVQISVPVVLSLDDLTDVTITTPAYNDYLTYDGAEWVNSPHRPRIVVVPYSPTVSLDWSVADVIRITLTGNIQITNTNAYDGQRCALDLTQDGTGGRSVAFTSETRFGTDIIAYAPSSTPNALDKIGFVYLNSAGKYDVVALVTGFV
jgi:hypothetical protein